MRRGRSRRRWRAPALRSSLSNGCSVTTGPKISSRLLAQSGPEALDHGRRDEPARAIERAAAAQHVAAFLARALRARPRTLSKCACETSGPSLLSSSMGSPTRSASARSTKASRNSVVDAALDQDARAAQADLAAVLEGRAHDACRAVRASRCRRTPASGSCRRVPATPSSAAARPAPAMRCRPRCCR